MDGDPGPSSKLKDPKFKSIEEPSSCDITSSDRELSWRSQENLSWSMSSRFSGSDEPKEALGFMKEVLDKLWENNVPGPQLLRLESEFALELGHGAQFKVTGPSAAHASSLRHALSATPDESLASTLKYLSTSVVKRAFWEPDMNVYQRRAEVRVQKLSRQDLTKQLHSQLRSAKQEIDRLCHERYKGHPNIVRLRGWGLCLDTFEAATPLNTRIPLLILERATCDLGDFLASSNYNSTSYEMLVKICVDIGTGLGVLHRGDVTHGDMKPENVLLFADQSSDPMKSTWTAKLCDFGCAQVKQTTSQKSEKEDYYGTYGWRPPEALLDQRFSFEELKYCDIFVYGLIVWRVFAPQETRGAFDVYRGSREVPIPPVIEEESKLRQYAKDRAYKEAAADIKQAFSERPGGDTPLLGKPMQGQIPTEDELRRILRVLRAALQPTPKYRDPRPWKYFDKIYFPNIRVLKETPGRETEVALISDMIALRIAESASYAIREIFEMKSVFKDTSRYREIIYTRGRNALSSLATKSPCQEALKSVVDLTASKASSEHDPNSLNTFEHKDGPCHDFVWFQSRLLKLCNEVNFDDFPGLAYELYAYARVRSRIKNCCWQKAKRQHISSNAIGALLCSRPERLQQLKMTRHNENRDFLLKIVVWLTRGQIGKSELTSIENGSAAANLWSWALEMEDIIEPQDVNEVHDGDLTPLISAGITRHTKAMRFQLSADLFHLFLERGCYVGNNCISSQYEDSDETVLSRYLGGLAKASNNATDNVTKSWVRERIIEACAKTKQMSQICLASEDNEDKNLGEVKRAKKRFFFKGESPDTFYETPSSTENDATMEIRGTTILHQSVLAFCYDAVQSLVKAAMVPLTVRDGHGENALELALRLKASKPHAWQLVQINLIIGLLTQKSKLKDPVSGLPLGWEDVRLANGLVVFRESTINPRRPSLTFKAPHFSLLRENHVALGSGQAGAGGLTYKFDLVRFMRTSKMDDLKTLDLQFSEKWYKSDIQALEDESRIYLSHILTPVGRVLFRVFGFLVIPGIRILSGRGRITDPVNFDNILLVFLPLSLFCRGYHWHNSSPALLFILTALSIIPLLSILDFTLRQLRPTIIPAHNVMRTQTMFSAIGACLAEVCVSFNQIIPSLAQ